MKYQKLAIMAAVAVITLAGCQSEKDCESTPSAPRNQQELIEMCGAEDMVWAAAERYGDDGLGCVHVDEIENENTR